MRPLRIDFAPMGFLRAVMLTRPLTWLLAAVGTALCVGGASVLHEYSGRHLQQQAQLERLLAMRDRRSDQRLRETSARQPVSTPGQVSAVNAAILQLNLPWRDLLDAVEAATPTAIALLALEPDSKNQRLKGTAEAKSSEAMLAYLSQLKQQAFFDEVVLTKHAINDQDPGKSLRFQFEAHWQGSAP